MKSQFRKGVASATPQIAHRKQGWYLKALALDLPEGIFRN